MKLTPTKGQGGRATVEKESEGKSASEPIVEMSDGKIQEHP